jgi:hypothetical protein
MHVLGEFWRKVHYSALFGDGKRGKMGVFALSKNQEQR